MPSFIITGFYGTSSESLINYASNLGHDTHLFNNDKLENETQIINTINLGKNFIFQFGQRPNIHNQIHIELGASLDDNTKRTNQKRILM